MRAKFLKMVIEHLNQNYAYISSGGQTIWFNAKDHLVALMDNGDLEIVIDILKEAVLKP